MSILWVVDNPLPLIESVPPLSKSTFAKSLSKYVPLVSVYSKVDGESAPSFTPLTVTRAFAPKNELSAVFSKLTVPLKMLKFPTNSLLSLAPVNETLPVPSLIIVPEPVVAPANREDIVISFVLLIINELLSATTILPLLILWLFKLTVVPEAMFSPTLSRA